MHVLNKLLVGPKYPSSVSDWLKLVCTCTYIRSAWRNANDDITPDIFVPKSQTGSNFLLYTLSRKTILLSIFSSEASFEEWCPKIISKHLYIPPNTIQTLHCFPPHPSPPISIPSPPYADTSHSKIKNIEQNKTQKFSNGSPRPCLQRRQQYR